MYSTIGFIIYVAHVDVKLGLYFISGEIVLVLPFSYSCIGQV